MTDRGGRSAYLRRIALPASLVLNLFLIAVIGGHLLRGNFTRLAAPPAGVPGRALANAMARLAPQDAAAFRRSLERDAPRFAPARQQLAERGAELARRVSAERFDPEATSQALAAWTASWDHFMASFDGPLVDALSQVSPEGRRKLMLAAQQDREQKLGPAVP